MKSLLIIFSFLAFGMTASAENFVNMPMAPREEVPVDYISWCEDNKVMAQSPLGDVVVRVDCTEYDRVCKATPAYRASRYIITAFCEAKN